MFETDPWVILSHFFDKLLCYVPLRRVDALVNILRDSVQGWKVISVVRIYRVGALNGNAVFYGRMDGGIVKS